MINFHAASYLYNGRSKVDETLVGNDYDIGFVTMVTFVLDNGEVPHHCRKGAPLKTKEISLGKFWINWRQALGNE